MIDYLVVTSEGQQNMESRIWDQLAYAARYGKQPLDVLLCMTLAEIRRFNKAVTGIVKEENSPRK